MKNSDKVPIFQKIIYGFGAFSNNLLGTASGSMTIALNLGLGLDPGKIGLLGMWPRLLDAITDPLMGYISDNTRTKWGRRRPYIFLGSIFCGLIFSLLWFLPEKADETFLFFNLPDVGIDGRGRDGFYFCYFLICSLIFYISYTVWVTPWVALGYELTPDYHERTMVMGFSSFIGNCAFVITPWFLWFMQHDYFGGAEGIMHGASTLALIISLIVIVCGILCAIFLKEPFQKAYCENKDKKQNIKKESFKENIKNFFKGFLISIKFKPFVKLCSVAFLIFNGFMLISAFSTYVIIYYVCQGDKILGGEITGWAGSAAGIFSFILVILVTALGRIFGKKNALLITTSLSVIGYLSKWWLFTPSNPWLSVIPGFFIAFGFGGLFPLIQAMIADICDLDELNTYQRREGMFGSIFWWVIKIGLAAALGLGGYLLNWTGFNVELITQTENTLFWMRFWDVVVPVLTSLIAILILKSYSIDESKANEIRDELSKRKVNHQST